jgi:hypothetical protein
MLARELPPLEDRPYGPDSNAAEVEAIRERIYVYRDGILMYVEVPVSSPFQVELFRRRMAEVSAGMTEFDVICDLTGARPPGAETRALLKDFFRGQTRMRRVAVFTGRNFLLNAAARFVLGTFGQTNLGVFKTLEEADASLGPTE